MPDHGQTQPLLGLFRLSFFAFLPHLPWLIPVVHSPQIMAIVAFSNGPIGGNESRFYELEFLILDLGLLDYNLNSLGLDPQTTHLSSLSYVTPLELSGDMRETLINRM